MKPGIQLEVSDTEVMRDIVTQAFEAGKAQAEAALDSEKISHSKHYDLLLRQIKQQAQILADAAFEAGRLSRPIS